MFCWSKWNNLVSAWKPCPDFLWEGSTIVVFWWVSREKANQTYFEPPSMHYIISLRMQDTVVAFKVHFLNRMDTMCLLCNSFVRFPILFRLANCMCAHTPLPQGWLNPWSLLYSISQDICGVEAPAWMSMAIGEENFLHGEITKGWLWYAALEHLINTAFYEHWLPLF